MIDRLLITREVSAKAAMIRIVRAMMLKIFEINSFLTFSRDMASSILPTLLPSKRISEALAIKWEDRLRTRKQVELSNFLIV